MYPVHSGHRFLSVVRQSLLMRGSALTAAIVVAVQPLLVGVASVAAVAPARAQVITDPAAPIQYRPTISHSGNGAPVVDIVTPSHGGVSHNKYQEFTVDTRGVILNNSGLGGQSIIGGAVNANPNLVGKRPAQVILNEVTSSSASRLGGPMEVFGSRADVIVANPNGIDCANCTFINAGKVTLSTGVPVVNYRRGAVAFDVRRGAVSIEAGGISAAAGQTPLANIDLIGRRLKIDGPVVTEGKARLRAGAMHYDQGGDRATPIHDAGPVTNDGLAITSSASGTIRAGTISVSSTDVDLDIDLMGELNASGLI